MGPNNGLKKKSGKSGFKDCFNVTDKMTLHISCVLIVQQNVCSRLKGLSTKAKLPSSEFLIIKKGDNQTNQPRRVALWSRKIIPSLLPSPHFMCLLCPRGLNPPAI